MDKDRGYLDSCLTINAFKNPEYLSNIRKSDRPLRVNCNEGAVVADDVGTFGTLQVHNTPVGLANIFSMPELEKKYPITYDSWEGYYIVHNERGEVQFYKDEQGLPFIDLTKSNGNVVTMHVQTVCKNYKGYTKKEVFSKPRKQDMVRI